MERLSDEVLPLVGLVGTRSVIAARWVGARFDHGERR